MTVLVLTTVFMLVEFAGGVVANSLALMADAGHMLTDAAAIGLALFAMWIARRPATAEKTFGFLRLEILAALVNGTALFVLAGLIVWDAVGRLAQPPEVRGGLLVTVAAAGFIVNVVAARLLHADHRHSLNVRGAYLHVLGDLLASVGTLAAGGIILATGWTPADPIISMGIAVLILIGAWRLVREAVDILLEAVPKHIPLGKVEQQLTTVPGVSDVHDLHVWTLTSGVVAMSAHAVVGNTASGQHVLRTIHDRMAGLGIHHVTMQLERGDECPTVTAL